MHPMGLSYSDSTGSALAIPSSGMATAASDDSVTGVEEVRTCRIRLLGRCTTSVWNGARGYMHLCSCSCDWSHGKLMLEWLETWTTHAMFTETTEVPAVIL